MKTTYFFAGALTIDGSPVNAQRFYSKKKANAFQEKTETINGFWKKVPTEKLSPTFQDSVVYVWTVEYL